MCLGNVLIGIDQGQVYKWISNYMEISIYDIIFPITAAHGIIFHKLYALKIGMPKST